MIMKESLRNEEIELLTRRELSCILKIGISSLDLISEDELPRVRIGRSVRFTLKAVHTFIQNHETQKVLSAPDNNNTRERLNKYE
jgi:predicted DNA-binding transcriptional regulator AlpA